MRAAADELAGLPPEFLTAQSSVAEEAIAAAGAGDARRSGRRRRATRSHLRPGAWPDRGARDPPSVRGADVLAAGPFDQPRRARAVAGALPGSGAATATRGLVGQAIKAIVIKVAKVAADKAVSFVLPELAEAFEKEVWKKRGLKEGWLKVSKDTLAAGELEPGRPVSPERSLLFIHGTFSNAASAYRAPGELRLLRSREGHVRRSHLRLRSLQRQPDAGTERPDAARRAARADDDVRRRHAFPRRARPAQLSSSAASSSAISRAASSSVARCSSPRRTTARRSRRRQRWDDTRRLDRQPARDVPRQPVHDGRGVRRQRAGLAGQSCVGRSPGLHAMDGDGASIAAIAGSAGPAADAYSALVANYQPTGGVLQRLLDVGIDQFFGGANDLVVPSEGGVAHRSLARDRHPAGSRIGCFGPGGNLPGRFRHARQLLLAHGNGGLPGQRAARPAAAAERRRSAQEPARSPAAARLD